MQVCFLLGPAGSGKTWRCLREIRAALAASPEGPPLLFLAPKQATFQLERQLLADPALTGYTRLQILSFERLAWAILEHLGVAPPRLLSEEGRVMVLRALLRRHREALRVFRASAHLPGFAQQLSQLLHELHQHRLSPQRLEAFAAGQGAAKGPTARCASSPTGGADACHLTDALRAKLHDLALLMRAYHDWLRAHEVEDADRLLDLATQALAAPAQPAALGHSPLGPADTRRLGAVWLDGFAEMTPQELALLKAVVALAERATLAFCLESESNSDASWLSPWSVVAQTFRRCRMEVAAIPGAEIRIETLPRLAPEGRFRGRPVLQHLAAHWTEPSGGPQPPGAAAGAAVAPSLRVVRCPTPDAEAILAARELLRWVRAGGRFRDCAVLVRSLEGYQHPVRRVFTRYGLPFFLDRRESIAHHPLAELTRYALRTVALGWRHEDWFGALKAGFAPVPEAELDALENEALARGWQGDVWLAPLVVAASPSLSQRVERLRRRLVPPFRRLSDTLGGAAACPSGAQLAAALVQLWNDLEVAQQLQRWADEAPAVPETDRGPATRGQPDRTGRSAPFVPRHSPLAPRPLAPAAIHATAWEQMNDWAESLALGFGAETLPLRDWLPIIEAGLAGLTVGVVPPTLDQVLVGAVDRSRNPDLKLAVVLGLNEGVFPAPPPAPGLLTEGERQALDQAGIVLSAGSQLRLAQERYLGYIACTRARERLVVTFAARDARDRPLNPSRLVVQLQQMFPGLAVEDFAPAAHWAECEHVSELLPFLASGAAGVTGASGAEDGQAPPRAAVAPSQTCTALPEGLPAEVQDWPAVAPWVARLGALVEPRLDECLSPLMVERLYGRELRTSITALERFAECPFRFLVHSGLRARERLRFEADPRALGSFQHEVLKRFHEAARAGGRQWRDWAPEAARELLGRVATEVAQAFNDGVLQASGRDRFVTEALTQRLADFVEATVCWLRRQYTFDPVAAELSFGEGGALPAYELPLSGGRRLVLRGTMDRVDVKPRTAGDGAWGVVLDYKAGARQIEAHLLENGLQLQLPAYLNVLRRLGDPQALFGVNRVVPAGVFYVNLRGRLESWAHRGEAFGEPEAHLRAFQHTGRFNREVLPDLDARSAALGEARTGDQFNYRLRIDGGLDSRSREAMTPEDFTAMLDRVEALLAEAGERIFRGEAQVAPYRLGRQTPCEHCDYRAICRFDPWQHRFRALRKPDAEEPDGGQGSRSS